MNYGEKIAELRKKHGMTQAELGDALNVTYQAVSKWERGESQPDFETMSKIAKLFNVPLGHFAGGENETQIYAQYAYAEAPAHKALMGTCTACGKVVYEGEECVTAPRLVCGSCLERERQNDIARRQAEEANRERQKHVRIAHAKGKNFDVKMIIAVIVALAFYALFTVLCFTSNSDDAMPYAFLLFLIPLAAFACTLAVADFIAELRDRDDDESYSLLTSLITAGCFAAVNAALFLAIYLLLDDNFYYLLMLGAGAVLSFTFVSQYMWGGTIGEIFTCGGFTFKLPGFIFSLTVDSILWMIVTKIFLGILAAILYVITTVLFAVIAILGSVFLFIPSLLYQIGSRRKAIKEA